jgi:hypothetical protein
LLLCSLLLNEDPHVVTNRGYLFHDDTRKLSSAFNWYWYKKANKSNLKV